MGYRLLPFPISAIARYARHAAVIAIPLSIIGVLITRSGKVVQIAGLGVLVVGVLLAALAIGLAVIALVEIWQRGAYGLGDVFIAVVLASLVLALPGWLGIQSLRLPRLNDVSTDLSDPPSYSLTPEAISARSGHIPRDLPLATREAQRRAYPALRTFTLAQDPEGAAQSVLEAIDTLKWKLVEEGRFENGERLIEAVAETRLMRFRDDVVIRIRAVGGETRIDIRSTSRIGRHDFGANAARIQRLVQELTAPKD